MTSIASSSVSIQTSSRAMPAPPPWFGEVVLLVSHLRKQNILDAISVQVRFARRRFGHFEVIDFVAVLFGYAVSGERTLEAFYQRLKPHAAAFMALFGRDRLPSRSALSRWLTALDQAAVEALRGLFLADLLARPLGNEQQTGGLWDRAGTHYLIFDVDGTREAARCRALPQTPDRPVAQRRLRPLCAPGYLGRKRGEVVRTRTTVLQAHTHHWLGTFGHAGNGEYRAELRRAVVAIGAYLKRHQVPKDACRGAPGWTIWHWSGPGRSGGPRVCDAGPRLSPARPGRSPDPPAPASRSAGDPSRERPHPRRL